MAQVEHAKLGWRSAGDTTVLKSIPVELSSSVVVNVSGIFSS